MKEEKITRRCQSCGGLYSNAVIRRKVVCQTCFKSLRKDNKERIKYNLEIPDNLSILKQKYIKGAWRKIK